MSTYIRAEAVPRDQPDAVTMTHNLTITDNFRPSHFRKRSAAPICHYANSHCDKNEQNRYCITIERSHPTHVYTKIYFSKRSTTKHTNSRKHNVVKSSTVSIATTLLYEDHDITVK